MRYVVLTLLHHSNELIYHDEEKKNIRDAVFIVVQERSCPLYNVGEKIKVTNNGLSISSYKPGCLILGQKLTDILTAEVRFSALPSFSQSKARFDCGGCTGLIHFEYKRDKDYATVQMKLLSDAEELRRRQHLKKFFGILRSLPIFEPLDDDALADLTTLLEIKTIPFNKVLIKKGDPGTHIYITLKGKLALIAEDGTKTEEIGAGELLGDMNLLSGEPFGESVHTMEITQVAMLSEKNFKHVIVKHPMLQLFLFRMLVERAQTKNLRSGNIASGMTGDLAEIPAVDLFQLINSSQKTGTIELFLDHGRALVFFNEGDIVHVRYTKLRNKDALFALLSLKRGRFSYTKGIPEPVAKLPPIGDFMGLLMEGLQQIDEREE